MGFKARKPTTNVPKKVQVPVYCPGPHTKFYTGMAKLNDTTWTVAFRCGDCGLTWAENLGKVEAHLARREFWGPGFSEDVEAYIAMINGWKAKKVASGVAKADARL